ncbi:SHOCT domain-containing protein [Pseudarthrobacter raffinosi]|uniref:SHOCT domain-containing protein n=1 Tax=Pseudarthrobacter raffinosi TaxID=2953651 RepID=UPI00208F0A51|nr:MULTISPECIES: SHOCT domain-containing protein [unclassified Pseudarthrobacter]MCO4239149.1 SHOCT domain-containing protein [Pseudarthrobacter sp. MDT3-28]MCO4253615.1 SHOCT domain-containing protein [Pseudarthrobacter sp. MDT3-9]MCO4264217.1 SHOCT domain-containing protein [Pseudarthrobacter sp. MDT3-26]
MMGGGLGMGWWWAIGLLMASALLWVIIRSVRAAGENSGQNNAQEPRDTDIGAAETPGGARGILAERYSRGELSAQEYQERLRVLGGGP